MAADDENYLRLSHLPQPADHLNLDLLRQQGVEADLACLLRRDQPPVAQGQRIGVRCRQPRLFDQDAGQVERIRRRDDDPLIPRRFVAYLTKQIDGLRQGILLAVCSKNNENEALAALRDHPHMLIREDCLAAHRINWDDKAANIRSLASELNISLEHMLLIDDSPHERAWVRAQIPELRVPEVPADPSLYADWVGSVPSLIVLQRTAEDAQRTGHYRQARDREAYLYLVESIRRFPRPKAFARMLEKAGFRRVVFTPMTGGVVALHSGWRL